MILIHTDSFFVKVILAPSDLLLFWCICTFDETWFNLQRSQTSLINLEWCQKHRRIMLLWFFLAKFPKYFLKSFFIKHTILILIFECFGRHSAQLFYFCWSSKYSWEPEQKHSGELFRPQPEKSAPKFRNVGIFCGLSTNVWWLWVSAKTVLPGGEKQTTENFIILEKLHQLIQSKYYGRIVKVLLQNY